MTHAADDIVAGLAGVFQSYHFNRVGGVVRAQDQVAIRGFEVRYSDAGWGAGYNGNLVGRFTSNSFTLTRYARAQTYFLRSYDGSAPPRYSRYSTALHVDYPLT